MVAVQHIDWYLCMTKHCNNVKKIERNKNSKRYLTRVIKYLDEGINIWKNIIFLK